MPASPPDYLFRLVAPSTDGTTTTEVVKSAADECFQSQDISQIDPTRASEILWKHLTWKCRYVSGCHLMSWTSSLLFALQYAFYRHAKGNDQPQFDEIYLFIIDTRGFPPGTFIRDLDILRKFQDDRNVSNFLALREGDYYFGEYLTQGPLDVSGHCTWVSVQDIIDNGLYGIHPELTDESGWEYWAKRVNELRALFSDLSTTDEDVDRAINIGCLFGEHRAVPVAIMLLAVIPRKCNRAVIIDGLMERFTEREIRDLDLGSLTFDPDIRLTEVQEYRRLIERLQSHIEETNVPQETDVPDESDIASWLQSLKL